MATAQQIRSAVAAAQGLMRGYGATLAADGIWSTQTEAAYSRLAGAQAVRVDAVVSAASEGQLRVDDLRRARDAERQSGRAVVKTVDAASMSKDDVRRLITGIALEEGVPPEAAIKFATVESRLNPNAVSKTGASGLFQLTGPAIAQIGIQPPNGNRLDPVWNARVGIKYMKWVARYLNVTFDNVGEIYAGYNLGVGNVQKLKQGKFDDPAVKGALALQAAALQTGGPRQYLANTRRFVDTAYA